MIIKALPPCFQSIIKNPPISRQRLSSLAFLLMHYTSDYSWHSFSLIKPVIVHNPK